MIGERHWDGAEGFGDHWLGGPTPVGAAAVVTVALARPRVHFGAGVVDNGGRARFWVLPLATDALAILSGDGWHRVMFGIAPLQKGRGLTRPTWMGT